MGGHLHHLKIDFDFPPDFYIVYNAWKFAEEYDLSGIDNLEEATVNGNPSWYTLNLHYLRKIDHQLSFSFGIENLLDIHYKHFASGLSASSSSGPKSPCRVIVRYLSPAALGRKGITHQQVSPLKKAAFIPASTACRTLSNMASDQYSSWPTERKLFERRSPNRSVWVSSVLM